MKVFQIYKEIDDRIAKHGLPVESRDDFFLVLRDVLPNCESTEEIDKAFDEQLSIRPHLQSPENVQITDEAALEAAFGANPTMAARGKLITAYGQEVYGRYRDLWNATDKNLAPGQNPKHKSAAPAAKADPKQVPGENSQSNPYHPQFRGDRAAGIASALRAFGSKGLERLARSARNEAAPHGYTIAGTPLTREPTKFTQN